VPPSAAMNFRLAILIVIGPFSWGSRAPDHRKR
jgi:hypothetical protein